jgi:hypothetical protein
MSSWDRIVGIATGSGVEDRRFRSSSPGRVKNFLFSTPSRPSMESTQPPTQWVSRTRSPGVRRPGREADHSPPDSAGDKINVDLYIHPLPPTVELD